MSDRKLFASSLWSMPTRKKLEHGVEFHKRTNKHTRMALLTLFYCSITPGAGNMRA